MNDINFSITLSLITDETVTNLVLSHDETRNAQTCNIFCLRIEDLFIINHDRKAIPVHTLIQKKIAWAGHDHEVTRLGSD